MSKSEILEYIYESEGADAFEVAEHLEIDYPAAAMALLRLSRQNLVARAIDPDSGIYWYELTTQGIQRLSYFKTRST